MNNNWRILLRQRSKNATMDRYIFQRPEKHRIHHEHQKHPNKTEIWFGIYEKPKEFNSSYGIGAKKELRLKDLLQYKIYKE